MGTNPQDPTRAPSFEARLEELNSLVVALERGDLGLEESIATFERGRKIHAELLATLGAFERRIEVLTKTPDGAERLVPAPEFDPDRTPAAEPEPPAPKAAKARAPAKPKPAYDDEVPF